MSNKYIYDGFLSSHTVQSIAMMSKDYHYVLELSTFPTDFQQKLRDYSQVVEDCQGQLHNRNTKMFGVVHQEGGGNLFLFLKSKEEWQLVLKNYPELVVNDKPFKTLV